MRDVDRIAALEALLIQLLGERFAGQLNPLRSLQTFGDRVHDIGGRSEAIDALLEQIDRRRKFIAQDRVKRD